MRRGAIVCVLAGLTVVAACQERPGESGEEGAAGRAEAAKASEDARPQGGDTVQETPRPADSSASAPEAGPAGSATATTEVQRPVPGQDTSFTGTTDPIHKTRTAPPVAILREVRAAEHPGYDRLVFEFSDGPLPGYHVEYADGAVQECGSGREVALPSESRLVVRLEPAQAHDDRGNVTIEERRRAPRLPTLRELSVTCDFEGRVEWVLGLAARVPYRVAELAEPARLVLDLGHLP